MGKYAILVGIDNYEDENISSLRFAESDIVAFSRTLMDLGYPMENIHVFSHSRKDAYASDVPIMKRFSQLCRTLEPSDTLIFYFAGHGIETKDGIYLMTANTVNYSLALLKKTSIPLKLLEDDLKMAKASDIIFIIDACRNDPEKARGDSPNSMTGNFSREIIMTARSVHRDAVSNPSTGVIFACSEGERAYEWPEKGHGVFSYYLIEGIKEAAMVSEKIELSAVNTYLRTNVANWCRMNLAFGKSQTPWCILTNGNPVFAKTRKGRIPKEPIFETPKAPAVLKPEIFKCLDMVYVEGGTFTMGDVFEDGSLDERPAHQVEISPFWIGKYLVTFEDFDQFCDESGQTRPKDKGWGRGERPVIHVSWTEAEKFCQWISSKTGRPYRLPTEAEWEYAARSRGEHIKWPGCEDEKKVGDYVWYAGNADSQTHCVGEKKPNSLGLFDMCGNTREWCLDRYDRDFYQNRLIKNPVCKASPNGSRVLRGGCWLYELHLCRVFSRSHRHPNYSDYCTSFRLSSDNS